MVAGNLTYSIAGAITKADGESCPPDGLADPGTALFETLGRWQTIDSRAVESVMAHALHCRTNGWLSLLPVSGGPDAFGAELRQMGPGSPDRDWRTTCSALADGCPGRCRAVSRSRTARHTVRASPSGQDSASPCGSGAPRYAARRVRRAQCHGPGLSRACGSRVSPLPGLRHPGQRVLARPLRRLQPRCARRVQSQGSRAVPLVHRPSHGRDVVSVGGRAVALCAVSTLDLQLPVAHPCRVGATAVCWPRSCRSANASVCQPAQTGAPVGRPRWPQPGRHHDSEIRLALAAQRPRSLGHLRRRVHRRR